MGVDNVQPEVAQDTAELTDRTDVASRRDASGQSRDGDVCDPGTLDLGDVRSRCRYREHPVPPLDIFFEFGEE
jgi:hypothetical protein